MNLDEALKHRLSERRRQCRYRVRQTVDSPSASVVRRGNKQLLNFSSNDYLALANHPRVKAAYAQAITEFGVGSGASHLVCGHSRYHQRLEQALAEFTGRERALLFSTGYMANLGTINALVGRGDLVCQDKLNHASLLDGGLISRAELQRFNHNDTGHLQTRLQASQARQKLIAVDGVFSMDGDLAPLPAIVEAARLNDSWLMVDDAHGFGVLGENGGGTVEHFGLNGDQVPVLMATLGKALGCFGAFVAGSETLIEALIQFSRPYIYTTAMPPAVAAAALTSLEIVRTEPQRREHLKELIETFKSRARQIGLNLLDSQTAIQPLMLNDDFKALKVAEALEREGMWVSPIRPPTVPEGTARLRITLTAGHTQKDIERLLAALDKTLTRGD